MFQNGMSEEVPNYFVQEEVAKHAHEAGVRGSFDAEQGIQSMFRNQFMDPRTQLLGQQQFQQQFGYPGTAFPPKVVNGDYIDSRMQLQQQLQQQQQQQQFRSQMPQGYFEPVQLQQQGGFNQAYDFQRHQHALQLEKLVRQQELFANQGMQLPRPPQQIFRPQMEFGSPRVENRLYMGNQVAKPLELHSEESLHDLFGGVDKVFGDDQFQEAKTAIPGLGSLGASLINGCEAELFGDSSLSGDGQAFGRGIFRTDPSKVPEPLVDRQVEHHSFPMKVPTVPVQAPGVYGVQMQQAQQPTPPSHFGAGAVQQIGQSNLQQRVDISAADRWQNKGGENFPMQQSLQPNNQMARNTLQLFRDMDETESSGHAGYVNKQIPGFDQALKAQPGVASGADTQEHVGTLDIKQRLNAEIPQVHFQPQPPQPSPDNSHWVKQPISKPQFHSSPGGERVSSPAYRIQPDRLLLDAGKQHQSDDVQRLLSIPGATSASQNVPGQPNELQNHQGDSAMKSRAYFEAVEQQKHVQNASRVHSANGPSNSVNSGYPQFQGYADSSVQRKISDNQPTGPSFPWNISVAPRQNSTPDAWLRNNSLDPYKSAGKPGFGASSMAHTDTPSTSEVVKPAKDTYMENGPSISTSLPDYRLSKTGLHITEKPDAEADPTELKVSGLRTQSQPPRFSSPMASFQDMNKRHGLGLKEKEAMISTSIFQSSAAAASQAALKSSSSLPTPPRQRSPVQQANQERQHVQPGVERQPPHSAPQQLQHSQPIITSGMGDAPVQPSSAVYARPAESDSINDIVQQQHQARVVPAVAHSAELPTGSKSEEQDLQHALTVSDVRSTTGNADDERTAMIKRTEQQFNSIGQVPQQQAGGMVQQHPANVLSQEAALLAPQQTPTVQVPQLQVPQQQPQTQASAVQKPQGVAAQMNHQQAMVQVPQLGAVVAPTVQVPQHKQPGVELSPGPGVGAQPQQAGVNAAALFMAQSNLAAGLQVSNPTMDLQRIMQSQMTLNQQQVQAALQAYAIAKGGGGTPVVSGGPDSAAGGPNSEPASTLQAMKQHLLLNSAFANTVLPKKRKLEAPPLLPWRMTISQQSGALPTIRPPELQWAAETNRLPEREGDEEYCSQDESLRFITRARQRLKLTTQLVQHTLPPVPAALMQSNTVEDRESATYILARLSLGEACRITPNEDQRAKTNTTPELKVDGYTDRIKYLENSLQRLENLPLTLEFVKNTQYLDKVCVTNRLMKCHHELFPVNFASQRRIQPVHRSYPQPYVTASPMPSTVPGGYQLIPL